MPHAQVVEIDGEAGVSKAHFTAIQILTWFWTKKNIDESVIFEFPAFGIYRQEALNSVFEFGAFIIY